VLRVKVINGVRFEPQFATDCERAAQNVGANAIVIYILSLVGHDTTLRGVVSRRNAFLEIVKRTAHEQSNLGGVAHEQSNLGGVAREQANLVCCRAVAAALGDEHADGVALRESLGTLLPRRPRPGSTRSFL